MVDVSTVKMLSKLWDPELKNGAPVTKYRHRALKDIRESIEELVYFKEHLWKIPASTSAKGTNKVESNGDILA
jgi:oligoribonuclease